VQLPRSLDADRLARLAEAHGTPLYVGCAATVRDRFRRAREAFPEAEICYAAKANGNPHLLRLLREMGASVDAVSLGEVLAAERAGYPPGEILYTGVFPPEAELDAVIRRGVRVNVNSASDLERVAEREAAAEIGVRVNPGVGAGHHRHVVTGGSGSKFGILSDRVPASFRRARELGLEPVRLHMHIGSGIATPEPILEGAAVLGRLAEELADDGFRVEGVDVGGGWAVPYRPGEEPLDLRALSRGLRERLPLETSLIVEPGRWLVAESTVLLTRVTAVAGSTVGVDAGLHTLIRPALYDAYHHLTNLTGSERDVREVTVVGPICESADVLAADRPLADPRRGDLLAVHTAGAYGSAMASRYNGRPLPGEVLVDGGARLVRSPEGWEDQFRSVPGW
jgi:diaminopimelate decarboxylase